VIAVGLHASIVLAQYGAERRASIQRVEQSPHITSSRRGLCRVVCKRLQHRQYGGARSRLERRCSAKHTGDLLSPQRLFTCQRHRSDHCQMLSPAALRHIRDLP